MESALRETAEEGVLLPGGGQIVHSHVHQTCAHWRYTTLLWRPGGAVATRPTGEAPEYRWVGAAETDGLPLHPAVSSMLDATGWLTGR